MWYETLSHPWGTAEEMGNIRDDKRRVRALVVGRVALAQGLKACVPADIATAWTEWERALLQHALPVAVGCVVELPEGASCRPRLPRPPPPLTEADARTPA